MGPATILGYLADLAGSAAPPTSAATLDVARGAVAPEWLGAAVPFGRAAGARVATTPALRRLAARDALTPTAWLLRLGWCAVTGTVAVRGERTTLCLPLLSQPVRLRPCPNGLRVSELGPPELTALVADPDTAARLEARAADVGDPARDLDPQALHAWVGAVMHAARLPPARAVLPPGESPAGHRDTGGLVACAGALVYPAGEPPPPARAGLLRTWAALPGLEATAFAAVYADEPAPGSEAEPGEPAGGPVVAPVRLGEAQVASVTRARRDRITVVTGPPGSGKSRTVAAIAVDAVARGASVLVATRSEHAAGVVSRLLARQPGPGALRFGGTGQADLVARLSEPGTTPDDIAAARDVLDQALAGQRLVEDEITAGLATEQRAEQAGHWDGLVDRLSALAPAAFAPDCPPTTLAEGAALAERAGRVVTGSGPAAWWGRRRRHRAARRLADELGAARGVPLVDLCTALECAADRRARAELEARGGTGLAPLWRRLAVADDEVRAAAGRFVAAVGASEQRRAEGRAAADDLGAALRAGRRHRRALLGRIAGRALVAALPVWVGTLRDVDDLLPLAPALFDLVVICEAGVIDQTAAAGTLLRARRAVLVGDPRQPRHPPPVTDDDLRRAQRHPAVARAGARLDVRRTSVLDLAAGRVPAIALDEHHRPVPRLMEFANRRFYGGRLQAATRHPAASDADVVGVVRAAGRENEVAAALGEVARLAGAGRRDIAVIAPARDVADAAGEALLAAYDLDEIERLGLRAGTVRAFQGTEADHVVLVLGLGPGDPPGRRRVAEDPLLFNVMVTRARRSLVVVTSLPPPADPPAGLVEEYLAHASRPAAPPGDGPCPTAWGDALALELREAGVPVSTGYPVGRWRVDLCVGEGAESAGIETAVHAHGAGAHIARHRALAAAGWRLADGYPSRWARDPARAAAELASPAPGERHEPPH